MGDGGWDDEDDAREHDPAPRGPRRATLAIDREDWWQDMGDEEADEIGTFPRRWP